MNCFFFIQGWNISQVEKLRCGERRVCFRVALCDHSHLLPSVHGLPTNELHLQAPVPDHHGVLFTSPDHRGVHSAHHVGPDWQTPHATEQREEKKSCPIVKYSPDHFYSLLHTFPRSTGNETYTFSLEQKHDKDLLSWTCSSFYQVVVYFYPDMPHHAVVYHLTVTLSSLNSCMDPVVYCFVTNNFQVHEPPHSRVFFGDVSVRILQAKVYLKHTHTDL